MAPGTTIRFLPGGTTTFLAKLAVCENDVVICPVLFFAIITAARINENKAMPMAAYRTEWEKVRSRHESKA